MKKTLGCCVVIWNNEFDREQFPDWSPAASARKLPAIRVDPTILLAGAESGLYALVLEVPIRKEILNSSHLRSAWNMTYELLIFEMTSNKC